MIIIAKRFFFIFIGIICIIMSIIGVLLPVLPGFVFFIVGIVILGINIKYIDDFVIKYVHKIDSFIHKYIYKKKSLRINHYYFHFKNKIEKIVR